MGALLSKVWIVGRAVNIVTNIGIQIQIQEIRIGRKLLVHVERLFQRIMPKRKDDAAPLRDYWPPFVLVCILLAAMMV